MKRICKQCKRVEEDDERRFCAACGEPLADEAEEKIYAAEWQGGEPCEVLKEREEERQTGSAALKMRAKTWFTLAFFGLLLDFIIGLGAFLCLPVAVLATKDAVKLYRLTRESSAKLLWAMTVGYLGALFGAVFFVLMI